MVRSVSFVRVSEWLNAYAYERLLRHPEFLLVRARLRQGRWKMRTHFTMLAIVGLVTINEAGLAQVRPLPPHPDLSGTWATATTDGLAYSPFGARFTVKQDASTVTITTARETVTYKFDDSENVRTTQTVTGQAWTRVSRARFVTDALVVTTRIDAGPTGHWEDLFIVSLDRPGEVTVVSCNAMKSMESGMSTRLFKYTKIQ
jgi:hypothetical protein